jgi:hypothetical protein
VFPSETLFRGFKNPAEFFFFLCPSGNRLLEVERATRSFSSVRRPERLASASAPPFEEATCSIKSLNGIVLYHFLCDFFLQPLYTILGFFDHSFNKES